MQRLFRVTHPFHPLYGEQFELLFYRNRNGGDLVHFYDRQGRQRGLPAVWTDIVEPDPFVVVSEGRSLFRISDLVELRRLLSLIDAGDTQGALEDV